MVVERLTFPGEQLLCLVCNEIISKCMNDPLVQVYPDDFGEFRVRVRNSCGTAEASAWVGEMPVGEEYLAEQEPDLPAWCNKVSA